MFLPEIKNILLSRTQLMRPKHMFPSSATQGNITSNNVSPTMFPGLARPLKISHAYITFCMFDGIAISLATTENKIIH